MMRTCKYCSWALRLRSEYGITVAQYHQMLVDQDNRCAICLKVLAAPVGVDHNHTTGKVRGIVHNTCNSMIGFAKEDIATLEGAILYLKKHMEVTT